MRLPYFFSLLFALVFVLPSKTAWSQEYIRGNDQGSLEILIKFIVVSNHLDARALLLDDPEFQNGIDLGKYPDADIHVKVEVKKISPEYKIELCGSCYTRELNMLSYSSMVGKKRLAVSGDKTTMVYRYNPSNRNSKNRIKLSLDVKDKNGNDWSWNLNSAPITFKKGASVKLDNLVKELEAAIQADDSQVIKKKCKEVYDLRDEGLGQSSSGKLDQLVILCDQALRNDNMPEHESAKAIWNATRAQALSKRKLHERKKVFEDYLKKYPESVYEPQARKEIKELEGRLKDYARSGNTKIKVDEQRKAQLKRIGDNFHIEEVGRAKTAKSVIITLECSNYEGTQPSLSGCREDIGIKKYEGSSKWEITAPKNIECEIAAYIDGVNFTKGNNIYKINTKVDPVSATFSPQQDRAMLITIKDGEPPYQLRFLQDDIVVGIKPNLPVNDGEFILNTDDGAIPGSGKFTLQVTDRSGNDNEKARSAPNAFDTGAPPWQKLLTLLGIAIAAMVLLLLYRKWKDKQINVARINDPGQRIKYPKEESLSINARKRTVPKVKVETAVEKRASLGQSSSHAADLEMTKPKIPIDLLFFPETEYHHLPIDPKSKAHLFANMSIYQGIYPRISEQLHNVSERNAEIKQDIIGWLYGRQSYDQKTGKYQLCIDRFMPATSINQSFPESLVDKRSPWAPLMDKYEEENLEIIGWVDTTENWKQNLQENSSAFHQTYFQQPYQFIMQAHASAEPLEYRLFRWHRGKGRYKLSRVSEQIYQWAADSKPKR